LGLLLCSVAQAEPPAERVVQPWVELDWDRIDGAAGCLRAAQLRAGVERSVGRSVFVSQAARARRTLRGHIEPRGHGFDAEIVLVGGPEPLRRTLRIDSERCADARDAVVLVASLLVDEAAASIDRVRVEPTEAPWGIAGAAALEARFGVFPGWVPSPGIGVTVTPPKFWPVSFAVFGWPPKEQHQGSGGGRFAGWSARLGVCPSLLSSRRVELELCVEGELVVIQAAGFGVAAAQSVTRLEGLPRLAGRLRVHVVGPFSIRFDAAGSVPVRRTRWELTAADGTDVQIYQAPPVAAGFGVHFELGAF
jgi:hypothetical protein